MVQMLWIFADVGTSWNFKDMKLSQGLFRTHRGANDMLQRACANKI